MSATRRGRPVITGTACGIGKTGSTLTAGGRASDNQKGIVPFRLEAERMEIGVQESQMRETRAAGESPADGGGVRVDQAELATRPLSQFILSKEYAGVSANPELIRPVTLVTAPRPASGRQSAAPPVAPAPFRRIEYPFYDSDDAPVPVPEPARDAAGEMPEPSAEPMPVGPESGAGPEVLDLTPDRPVAPPRPSAPAGPQTRDIPFQPIRLPSLLISHSAVSGDELTAPLPGARIRNGEFPILDYFLKAASRRR